MRASKDILSKQLCSQRAEQTSDIEQQSIPQTPHIKDVITWVYTQDIDKTCQFYSDILGLKLSRNEGVARVFQLSQSAFVGVCEDIDWRVVEPKGGMLTIVTDDVDRWYARLIKAGVTCKSAPEKVEKFGIYAFVAEDPNGYLIEFQQFLDEDET